MIFLKTEKHLFKTHANSYLFFIASILIFATQPLAAQDPSTADMADASIRLVDRNTEHQELLQATTLSSHSVSLIGDSVKTTEPSLEVTFQDEIAADPSEMPDELGLDAMTVASGEAAFMTSCTQCHDAERALNKQKDLAGWLATVRRMSRKEGAEIARSDIVPIATYLTSLNPQAGAEQESSSIVQQASGQGVDFFMTVSMIHRSGRRQALHNPGFFPEVWFGADWQGDGPLSARVQACVTCHSESLGGGSRIELAEGFFRLDLVDWLSCCVDERTKMSVDAGRFIVPFGAFSSQSHPGAYRTATRPLMYNMGRTVFRNDIGPAILPMPYADEGVLASASIPLTDQLTATLDFYSINGLQGSDSVNFFLSRDYVDNNSEPSVGGRVTLGNKFFRGGASLMSGRFNSEGSSGSAAEVLDYKIYGFDLTARLAHRARLHAEYVRRISDTFSGGVLNEDLQGFLLEGEMLVWDQPRIGLVVRYDDQRRESDRLILGSSVPTGYFGVRRITWGFNITLAGGSTLMINHEHWKVPDPLDDLDVLAIRWVATF